MTTELRTLLGELRYDRNLGGVRNWAGCRICGRICRSCGYFLPTSSSRNEATLPYIAVGLNFSARLDLSERWTSRLVATAEDHLREDVMKSVVATSLALSLFACCDAYADVITFDNLPDGTIVTNQFPGVSFTPFAVVLTKGVGLNPDFPPVSDPNVIGATAIGTIAATFTTPVSSVGAFVTGSESVTESIFRGLRCWGPCLQEARTSSAPAPVSRQISF